MDLISNEFQKYFSSLADDSESLSENLITQLCRLANSTNYCQLIFSDWSEQILFLEIEYEKELLSKTEIEKENFKIEDTNGSLYEKIIQSCSTVLDKSLQGLSTAIVRSFQAYSYSYFNDKYVLYKTKKKAIYLIFLKKFRFTIVKFY